MAFLIVHTPKPNIYRFLKKNSEKKKEFDADGMPIKKVRDPTLKAMSGMSKAEWKKKVKKNTGPHPTKKRKYGTPPPP